MATSSLVLLPETWKLRKCARYIMSSRKHASSQVSVSLNSAVDGEVSPLRFALFSHEPYRMVFRHRFSRLLVLMDAKLIH